MNRTMLARKLHDMRTGDLLVFGGVGPLALAIRARTWSRLNHVEMVVRREGRPLESFGATAHQGRIGVQLNPVREIVLGHEGWVWWLPLLPIQRMKMEDPDAVERVIHEMEGRPYDFWQVLQYLTPFRQREDFAAMYCSELIAYIYRDFHVLPESVNPSRMTPKRLIKQGCFHPEYWQLRGPTRRTLRRVGVLHA